MSEPVTLPLGREIAGFELVRVTALSQEEGRPRQYVQDLVGEEAELVHKLWMEGGGSLYVCGKVAMARGVREQLGRVVGRIEGLAEEEVEERLQQARVEGRYAEDIFTS